MKKCSLANAYVKILILSVAMPATSFAGVANQQLLNPNLKSKKMELDLKSFMNIVSKDNYKIKSSLLDSKIANYSIQNEEGKFDTVLFANAKIEKNEQRNTVQDSLSLSSLSAFEENNTIYSIGLRKKTKIGTQLEFEVRGERIDNNVQPDFIRGREHVFNTELTVRQPILKGAGGMAALDLRMAEKNSDVAFHKYRQLRFDQSIQAVNGYWDFYQAQESLKIREKSSLLLAKMLKISKQQVKLGSVPLTDFILLESELATSNASLSLQKQRYVRTMNNIKNYMSVAAVNQSHQIIAKHAEIEKVVSRMRSQSIDLSKSVLLAYAKNPAYQAAKLTADRQHLQLIYADNQLYAELDVVASYRRNGLATNLNDSVSDSYNNHKSGWSIGMEFTMPLSNNQNLSKHGIAKAQKMQAIYAIKEQEVRLSNLLSTTIEQIANHRENIQQINNIVNINKRIYKINSGSYKRGKGTVNDVIGSERRLGLSKEKLIAAYVEHQKSYYLLKKIEGGLLEGFGIQEPQKYSLNGAG
ncbi:MAG: TolC family protein [Oceanospirillaceae bacterium]